MRKSIKCTVSGRVQGVFFRVSAREVARSLALDGWVRNLRDGRVEVYATGPESCVDELHQWLKTGPDGARVIEVVCHEVSGEKVSGFSIR